MQSLLDHDEPTDREAFGQFRNKRIKVTGVLSVFRKWYNKLGREIGTACIEKPEIESIGVVVLTTSGPLAFGTGWKLVRRISSDNE